MGTARVCLTLGSAPQRSEDLWLIVALITANVLQLLPLATGARGGAVELMKTQTFSHSVIASSEGWDQRALGPVSAGTRGPCDRDGVNRREGGSKGPG